MSEVERTSSQTFEDPLSPELFQLLVALAKAARGMRVYAQNNEMLRRFVDEAYAGLTAVLEKVPEVTLAVREDRLLYGKDPVHVNTDREDGLPFVFYRNAFRRLTIVRGMSREELWSFLQAITGDYNAGDAAGEDLVTALWRLSLPHLRYLTIDAMTIDPKTLQDGVARNDVERIQGDIEDIVARIYQTDTAEEDIVAGVSITKDDLEALKDIRLERSEDLDLLDVATARAIADIAPAELNALQQRAVTTKEAMSARLTDILVEILFKEQAANEFAATMDLLLQLFDSLLVAQLYERAVHLIARLYTRQSSTENLKEIHICQHLLRTFSAEARVVPVLNTLNDERKTSSVMEVIDFLRALGPGIVPLLIDSLDFLNSPSHRRLICDLILEYGVPERRLLQQKIQSGKWFVTRDVLLMAQRLPLEHITSMVAYALQHEHPKVREHAVGILRGYGRGAADRLVAERILDPDPDVRQAAIRVAAARRSVEAKPVIEALLEKEDLAALDVRELRMLISTYANIAGWEAVPALEKVLNPGFFARTKQTEAQVAAAYALATIGTASATAALQKGMRTLNSRVRDACKRALAREPAQDLGTDIPKAVTPIGELPRDRISDAMSVPAELRGEDAARGGKDWDSPSGRYPKPEEPSSGRFHRELEARAARPGVSDSAPDFVLGADLEISESKPKPPFPRMPEGIGRVLSNQPVRDEIRGKLPEVTPPSSEVPERGFPQSAVNPAPPALSAPPVPETTVTVQAPPMRPPPVLRGAPNSPPPAHAPPPPPRPPPAGYTPPPQLQAPSYTLPPMVPGHGYTPPPRVVEGMPTPDQLSVPAGVYPPPSSSSSEHAFDPPSAWSEEGSLGGAAVADGDVAPSPRAPPASAQPAPPPAPPARAAQAGLRPEYRGYREDLPVNIPAVELPAQRAPAPQRSRPRAPPPPPREQSSPPPPPAQPAPVAPRKDLTDDLELDVPPRKG